MKKTTISKKDSRHAPLTCIKVYLDVHTRQMFAEEASLQGRSMSSQALMLIKKWIGQTP